MATDSDLLLFDLGGVLVDTSGDPLPSDWLPDQEVFQIKDWFASPTASAFERGTISPLEFATSLRNELNVQASVDEILDHFTGWPSGLFPGAADLLGHLREHHTLAVLSNTNELHWPRVLDEFRLAEFSDHLFASHLMGIAKPDEGAFRHVLDAMAVDPATVVFFDDNPMNVEMAMRLGIDAVETHGVTGLVKEMTDRGLVRMRQE